MSCVTGVTGITGTKFLLNMEELILPKNLGMWLEKLRVSLRGNLQLRPRYISKTSWMKSITKQVSGKIWNIITCLMDFGAVLLITWVSMKKNKTMVFTQGKKAASKKAVIMSKKVASTSTSTNDVSQ